VPGARALRRPRALLFDLDGTLVDSRRDIAQACNFALTTAGRAPLEEAAIASFVGDGARMLLARALGVDPTASELDAALASFSLFYTTHAADSTRWMPGALAALDALSELPMGIVTNKPRAATLAVLDALDARGRFASIVAGGDGPLKPDPAAIDAALAPMHLRAEEAWMVGDGPQDIAAGRAAGCPTIGVRGGFASDALLEAAAPDRLLRSIAELVPLVWAAS
jgi:phosphoglycolate phosphatase